MSKIRLNAIVFFECKNFCCDCYFEMVVQGNLITINFILSLCRIMYVKFTEPHLSFRSLQSLCYSVDSGFISDSSYQCTCPADRCSSMSLVSAVTHESNSTQCTHLF